MKNTNIKLALLGLSLITSINVMASTTYYSKPTFDQEIRNYSKLEINSDYIISTTSKDSSSDSNYFVKSDPYNLIKKIKVNNSELVDTSCKQNITFYGYIGEYSDCEYNNYFIYDNKIHSLKSPFQLDEVLVYLQTKDGKKIFDRADDLFNISEKTSFGRSFSKF